MNLIEEIKASLLSLKKDYPYGILDDQVIAAFNFGENSDLDFLNNIITKGFKFIPAQYRFGGSADLVVNFGEELENKFIGKSVTLNVKSLREISESPELKKQLWGEIQKILKLI